MCIRDRRNTVLNSNDYFLKASDIKRPAYQRNQFGGCLLYTSTKACTL